MYRRQAQIRQAVILLAVLLLSFLLQWAVRSVAAWYHALTPQAAAMLILQLQTGVKPAEEIPSMQQSRLTDTFAAAPLSKTAAVAPLTFTAQEAQAIEIIGACTYSYDKAALLLQPLPVDFSSDGPQVLIVHTHTTESYTPEAGQAYDALSNARTLDDQYNMIRVGQQVAAVLESHGIGVIHDTTVNDYPDYNGSYDRMKTVIAENLARYPSIRMVLDIHRDAASDESGNPIALVASTDQADYAQLMLVVGTDEGGLDHPNWQQNLSTALKLQVLLERNVPGLCRNLNLRQERFNQNQTPCSLLVEIGTDGNTLTQALHTADALGEAVSQLILSSHA